MATDVLAMMDQEAKRAKEQAEKAKSGFTPTFLRLADKQQAKIRPLFNLSQCVVLAMHNKWNQADFKQSINAVCGKETGGDCLYCEAAENDKKLTAGTVFFLPVYVSVLEQQNDSGIWIPVTYEKDGQTFEVNGLRILELKAFGAASTIFETVRKLHREDDQHDIRRYGLIVERIGSGQKTDYTVLPKGPSGMPDAAKKLIPTAEEVKKMVLAAMPPAGTVTVSSSPKSSAVSEKDNDF